MQKIMNLEDTNSINSDVLREYISKKITFLMEEYHTDNLKEIGCFVVLEENETEHFVVNEMEFTEVLKIGEEHYLHGVRIVSDSFGEDIFLPVEEVIV